ncbi:MAG: response regulator [Bacteroidetes bacterium]|nr:MAG: response regulator [Bacteroidota bacterium]
MRTDQINLLLADDDMDDCDFFKDALNDLSIATNLTLVHNGVELMQLLTKKELELPHALYLDFNMPRKNGFECLIEIRSNEKLKELPIIIFSTSFDKEVVDLLYVNGANYYIRKPAEFSNLKKVIFKSLTLILGNNDQQPLKENFIINSI